MCFLPGALMIGGTLYLKKTTDGWSGSKESETSEEVMGRQTGVYWRGTEGEPWVNFRVLVASLILFVDHGLRMLIKLFFFSVTRFQFETLQ